MWLLMIITVVTGALLPVQAGINAHLGKATAGPVMAAFISFLVGSLALAVYLFIIKRQPVNWGLLQNLPLWLFAGGLIGAFYVAASTYMVPTLGAALAFALIIAGQLIAAIVIDHFGWLGMAVREISAGRIVGIVLLIIGVILIRKY